MPRAVLLSLVVLATFTGCAGAPRAARTVLSGPESPAAVVAHPWSYRGELGSLLRTAHYEIHTTIPDDEVVSNVAQLMEGAYEQYRLLAPGVAPSTEPMECYLFKDRSQWAVF